MDGYEKDLVSINVLVYTIIKWADLLRTIMLYRVQLTTA